MVPCNPLELAVWFTRWQLQVVIGRIQVFCCIGVCIRSIFGHRNIIDIALSLKDKSCEGFNKSSCHHYFCFLQCYGKNKQSEGNKRTKLLQCNRASQMLPPKDLAANFYSVIESTINLLLAYTTCQCMSYASLWHIKGVLLTESSFLNSFQKVIGKKNSLVVEFDHPQLEQLEPFPLDQKIKETSDSNSSFCEDSSSICQFPGNLHIMLEDAEKEEFTDVVSWVVAGNSLKGHNRRF